MQGIDLMIDITTEFEEKICPSVLKSELYTNFFHEMKMHMRNIRNTNAFMMMSINRTMDYTKASRGLKLVPSMDTIDLLETLSLPLNCMKNIQNRVHIHLLPIHSVICNYIVTDKQWLQENILCLLSNSAKYSSDGEVTVKVSLRSKRSPYLESRNKLIDPSSPESSMQLKSTSTMVKSFDRDSVVPFDKPETKEPPKKNYLLFEVEDNGIGMEKETMLSLFSPFKQAQRLAGGTGLGLYSLSKRIESLEGDYGVRERKDGKPGCLFWFTIPYIPDPSLVPAFEAGKQFVGSFDTCMDAGITGLVQQSQPLRSPLTSHPGSPTGEKRKLAHAYSVPTFALKSKLENLSHHDENPATSTTATTNDFPMTTANSVPTILIDEVTSIDHKKARFEGIITEVSLHILLVEDSPTIAKMTSLLLTKLGYRVTHAENGHIALKKMIESKENKNGHPFDLVLMDFQMPVMDGLEATKRYREYEKLHPSDQHPLIIIGLSATFDKEIVQDAMKMGLDDYLMKPIQKDTFLKKIEKVFQKVSKTSLQQPGVSHLSSGSTVMEDVDEQRLFLECHG
jgi:CheY-like chemotaxis protein